MKTKIFLLVMLFVFAVSVNAQTKAAAKDTKSFKIGIGVMAGLPMGEMGSGVKLSDAANLAYGGDLTGEYAVAPSFAVTLSVGYIDWVWKSAVKDAFDQAGIKMSMIPVLAGAKYYFTDKLYGSAQIGKSFFTMKDAGSLFTFAPGIGFKVSENFDLLLKYQSSSQTGGHLNFLGLRAGLTF